MVLHYFDVWEHYWYYLIRSVAESGTSIYNYHDSELKVSLFESCPNAPTP